MFLPSLFSSDTTSRLADFVRGSNLLAGIDREPSRAEVAAHRGLIAVDRLRVENLLMLMRHLQSGATLRRKRNSDSAASQSFSYCQLQKLIDKANDGLWSAERLHLCFRQMRPFSDGNGRCGRALWLWQAVRERDNTGLDTGGPGRDIFAHAHVAEWHWPASHGEAHH